MAALGGVFVSDDEGDTVTLLADGERLARAGWVNVGPHAIRVTLDRDGNLRLDARPRTQEGAVIKEMLVSYQQTSAQGGEDPEWNWEMIAPSQLLAHFEQKYPHLAPRFVDKAKTAYVDDLAMPPQLIALTVADMEIVDPYMSSCGRFAVDPTATYGIDGDDAKYLWAVNRPDSAAETSVEARHESEQDRDAEAEPGPGSAPGG